MHHCEREKAQKNRMSKHIQMRIEEREKYRQTERKNPIHPHRYTLNMNAVQYCLQMMADRIKQEKDTQQEGEMLKPNTGKRKQTDELRFFLCVVFEW
jgi:hypothetical protein